MDKHYDCKPLQVLIEKNGKVIKDFTEATPVSVEIYYDKDSMVEAAKKQLQKEMEEKNKRE